MVQLFARSLWMRQPAQHQRLCEPRTGDFALPLDEACFFANALASSLRRCCRLSLSSVMVVMEEGLSCFAVRSFKITLFP